MMQDGGVSTERWTVARLLDWTRDYFQRSGLESPRLCAEILLAHALGCDRLELYTRPDCEPAKDKLAAFRATLRDAAAGKPIAYITGRKEFFALTFAVTPSVLVPRPETETLVERVIHSVRFDARGARRLLEIGVGSGCVIVSIAKQLPDLACSGSDISGAALEVARGNVARHGLSERIELREGDLFAPWVDEAPFDLIISNPPYIGLSERAALPANVREHEPPEALFAGDDGLAIIRRIASEAGPRLAPGGSLFLELGWNQAASARRVLDEAGWRDIVTYKDDLRHERVMHAHRIAGAGAAASKEPHT